ncbi:GntR family transcriptional regulator [Oceanicella sp. SM1341]|uniref:GntR family transcriptional regulator n=1 Tax=Oceanicella sp. SM1341 TaxID=1548889 RepID=UPI0018E52478|nr:GntR family transcriptional regulator [Oceanicella sp. SM1341]
MARAERAAEGAGVEAGQDRAAGPGAHLPQAELAYRRIEAAIVTCALPPGSFQRIQDLAALAGTGRTPVHQAVNRLAADTLLEVQPRQGLLVAPVELGRARVLLDLRREVERFAITLAASRADEGQRSRMRHLAAALRAAGAGLDLAAFNAFDSRIDALVLEACGEPFLGHTLRPLHAIFRRVGWIWHGLAAGSGEAPGAGASVIPHLAVLDALAEGRGEEAATASDALVSLVGDMLDQLSRNAPPRLLDSRLESY